MIGLDLVKIRHDIENHPLVGSCNITIPQFLQLVEKEQWLKDLVIDVSSYGYCTINLDNIQSLKPLKFTDTNGKPFYNKVASNDDGYYQFNCGYIDGIYVSVYCHFTESGNTTEYSNFISLIESVKHTLESWTPMKRVKLRNDCTTELMDYYHSLQMLNRGVR